MDEINELREQMAAMRKSLEDYQIVNKRLINTVMKKRSQGLSWFVNGEIIALPFICLALFGFCYALGMSVWIAVTMTVACIVSTIVDLKTMRVPADMINLLNMKDFRSFLVRQKRMRKLQLLIESPLCAAWIIWFIHSYFSHSSIFDELRRSEGYIWVEIAVVAFTVVVSAIVIAVIFLKSQEVNNSLISDIDSYEDENPES